MTWRNDSRERIHTNRAIIAFCVICVVCGVIRSPALRAQDHPSPPQRGTIPAPIVQNAATPTATPTATPAATPTPATDANVDADSQKDPIVAIVNGDPIRKSAVLKACLECYGDKVLEVLTNKLLIVTECEKQKVNVTPEEVQAEIARIAKAYNITPELYLGQILETRGISRLQYEADIVWPELALGKLASDQITFTDEELMVEYEKRYGEAIKALMIQVSDKAKADEIRAKAIADPNSFGDLAKNFSEDSASASLRGTIPLIRRHLVEPNVEKAIFAAQDGEITDVFQIENDYVILQRLEMMPPLAIFEQIKEPLKEELRTTKIREIRDTLLRELQKTATVENVFNDPERSKQLPGVAAIINGTQVRTDELAERCMERYGSVMLKSLIDQKLIEQMLKKKDLSVTPEEIQAELESQAAQWMPLKDGKPDVQGFLLSMISEGFPESVFRNDVMWKMVALKKLVEGTYSVSDAELHKGFEARYGARVQVRAIFLDNLRRAQEAWDLARKDPSPENFAKLAKQYSTDPDSAAVGGQMPPIPRNTGREQIEKEVFSLKPGEISSIVSLGQERYVIMLCEGMTEPVDVDFDTVKDDIQKDLMLYKRDIQIGLLMDECTRKSRIDNFLDGTSTEPESQSETDEAGVDRKLLPGEEIKVDRTENTELNP